MKGTRLINRFSEKKKKNSHLGKWAISDPKIAHSHNSGFTGRIFFLILHNESGYEVDENDSNDFFKKKFVWDKWIILSPKMVHLHNPGSAIKFFLILHNEESQ